MGFVPAAEYLRMSTEHQRYSIDSQSDAIRDYARQRGYEIVQTYLDAGRSGLTIKRRDGLRRLLSDVEGGSVKFTTVLVYDISRWGRFQDSDEAAAYEFRCRAAGVKVVYCAEQFENDGSIGSDIIKMVKRKMAAEYSRELSVKVFAGKVRQIRNGFHQGGDVGIGLRRQLVDEFGRPKMLLEPHQIKALDTDRVILVPGPAHEIAIVNDIFRWFVEERLSERAIARRLNSKSVPFRGRTRTVWNGENVHDVLVNERYIGNNVWAKRSYKLKGPERRNPPEEWVRADRVFKPIVDESVFRQAQQSIGICRPRRTDADMLGRLRELLAREGKLNAEIVRRDPDTPQPATYFRRFGGLLNAYRLIGYLPKNRFEQIAIERCRRALLQKTVDRVIQLFSDRGIPAEADTRVQTPVTDRAWCYGVVRINHAQSILIEVLRSVRARKTIFWRFRKSSIPDQHCSVVVRMDRANKRIQDYLLFPSRAEEYRPRYIREVNEPAIDSHKVQNLEPLLRFFKPKGRSKISNRKRI